MAVAIIFNHHYTLDGIDYLPGDGINVDEGTASALLFSMKARLAEPAVVDLLPTTYVTEGHVQDQIDAYAKTIDMRSAYQIALDNGYVGTEAEWIDSLKGAPGDPGDLMPSQSFDSSGTFTVTPAQLPSTMRLALIGNLNVALSTSPFPATLAGTITLIIKQATAAGPFSLTWPAGIEWTQDAVGPAMPSQGGAEVVVHLFWTGSGWRGVTAGIYFP